MTERVIAEFRNEFVVESAEYHTIGSVERLARWGFERAFRLESDAIAFAERIAEDRRWVRVVTND